MACHSLVRVHSPTPPQSASGSKDQGKTATTISPTTTIPEHPLMEEKATLEAMNRELSQMILKMNTISGK